MLGYLERSVPQSALLFAPEGTLEFPYFCSIGLPRVLRGPANIERFLAFLHDSLYPGFQLEKVMIHIETPQQVLAEYHILNRSGTFGRNIKQQVFGHLTAEGGKIKRLMETTDVILAAEAIFPAGLAAITERRAGRVRAWQA